jgi:phosphate transport system permease protein
MCHCGPPYSRRHYSLTLIAGALARAERVRFELSCGPQRWAPVRRIAPVLGALGPIYGTLVTSVIAMLIAIPVGLGIAIFLTELCPAMAAPADRHGDRIARRHSLDHLRHVGLSSSLAVPREYVPALHDPIFEGVPVLGAIFAGPPSASQPV